MGKIKRRRGLAGDQRGVSDHDDADPLEVLDALFSPADRRALDRWLAEQVRGVDELFRGLPPFDIDELFRGLAGAAGAEPGLNQGPRRKKNSK